MVHTALRSSEQMNKQNMIHNEQCRCYCYFALCTYQDTVSTHKPYLPHTILALCCLLTRLGICQSCLPLQKMCIQNEQHCYARNSMHVRLALQGRCCRLTRGGWLVKIGDTVRPLAEAGNGGNAALPPCRASVLLHNCTAKLAASQYKSWICSQDKASIYMHLHHLLHDREMSCFCKTYHHAPSVVVL